jgi:hypothetical protein
MEGSMHDVTQTTLRNWERRIAKLFIRFALAAINADLESPDTLAAMRNPFRRQSWMRQCVLQQRVPVRLRSAMEADMLGLDKPPPLKTPTATLAQPGSPEKVAELATRYRFGYELFHPYDAKANDNRDERDTHGSPNTQRRGRCRRSA